MRPKCGSVDIESFLANAFDPLERIHLPSISLDADWLGWKESPSTILLEPEVEYEGSNLPLKPSTRGAVMDMVRQIRDPGISLDGNKTYLLYVVSGELGIVISQLLED